MKFNLHCPETTEEALRLKRETGGAWLAGGTVLLVNAHQGKTVNGNLISLEKLDGLCRIRETADAVAVGALVTFDEIERSELIRALFPALWEAAAQVGGPQIRHRATLGGNIACASPASDGVTPLMALDASVRLVSGEGERLVKLTEFYTGKFKTAAGETELLTEVIIPKGSTFSRFVKVGKRSALAVSIVNIAMVKAGDAIRLAVGSAAPEVRFCEKTSAALTEGRLDEARTALQQEISPIDDRWGTADYRRSVAENLMLSLYKETEEQKA